MSIHQLYIVCHATHSELPVSAQTLPNLTQFQVTKFQTYRILIKSKKKIEITFFKCGRFILVGMKCNKAEVVDEYCWLITLAAGWSYCGQSVSSVLEFRFHLEALICTGILDHTYTKFELAPDFWNVTCCMSWGVSAFLFLHCTL